MTYLSDAGDLTPGLNFTLIKMPWSVYKSSAANCAGCQRAGWL